MNTEFCQELRMWKEWSWEANYNFSWDQKRVVDSESRLFPRKINKTTHSFRKPYHINKISNILPEIWLSKIRSSNCEKVLGIKIDDKRFFNEHLNYIVGKASCRISKLSRVAACINESKMRILMNSFFWSEFSYCSLMWVCNSRTVNNKINRLHERCLRLAYNFKKSTYENWLVRDRSVSVHIRNIQILDTEMCCVCRDLSPSIFKEIFNKRILNCESIACLGAKIWNMVSSKLKEISSISSFKKAIKEWYPRNCLCRLCKSYWGSTGFI